MGACGRRWGNAGGWTAPGSWSHRTTVKQESSGSEVTHDGVGGTNRRMVVLNKVPTHGPLQGRQQKK